MDEFFARTDSSGSRSLLTDALGSTIALADDAGVLATEYACEPFGKTDVTGAADSNPFQFTGRENDGTGLYHYRARYYSPTLGRFLSEDPIGFDGGDPNLYAYVWNSPANFVDPTGETPWAAAGACVGGAVFNVVLSGRKGIGRSAASGCMGGLSLLGLGSLARTAFAARAALPLALRGGSANVHVYYGIINGKNAYVGITNNLIRRQAQHGARFSIRRIQGPAVTRGQARAIEEALIVRAGGVAREGGRFQNINHSISPSHPWHRQAVDWGEAWLRLVGL